jgi:hypothetical protein
MMHPLMAQLGFARSQAGSEASITIRINLYKRAATHDLHLGWRWWLFSVIRMALDHVPHDVIRAEYEVAGYDAVENGVAVPF